MDHTEAYALAADSRQWWLASSRAAAGLLHDTRAPTAVAAVPPRPTQAALQIDNHWVLRAS